MYSEKIIGPNIIHVFQHSHTLLVVANGGANYQMSMMHKIYELYINIAEI